MTQRWWIGGVLLLGVGLLTAGCLSAAPTPHPTVNAPTVVPAPTINPAGDPVLGAALFSEWQCVQCHGLSAEGGVGPTLAATTMNTDRFITAVRETRSPKPAFSEEELSDIEVVSIRAWLRTLDPPLRAGSGAVLAEGEVFGMQVYTQSGCDDCHGAFAQGSSDGTVLAYYSDDVETYLQAMRDSTDLIPGHDLNSLDEGLMRRLYRWLKEGANPVGGC